MKDLPPLLEGIPHLRNALYADDLTLWTPTGSIGEQQDAMQAGIEEAHRYLRARSLEGDQKR